MAKKVKAYTEAELIDMFNLNRLAGSSTSPLMREWTNCSATLNMGEQYLFDLITLDLGRKIVGWNEEMLKMNFIAFVLQLGHLVETERYKTYYESTIEGTINGYFLKVKTDMIVATGILETPKIPYFYFQEYISTKLNASKKVKNPQSDVSGQLLEAFLIAQDKNKNDKPLYGCTVSGREWEFYIMEGKDYCVSNAYNCTNNADLMQIIAILRKFKEILETRLLD